MGHLVGYTCSPPPDILQCCLSGYIVPFSCPSCLVPCLFWGFIVISIASSFCVDSGFDEITKIDEFMNVELRY